MVVSKFRGEGMRGGLWGWCCKQNQALRHESIVNTISLTSLCSHASKISRRGGD